MIYCINNKAWFDLENLNNENDVDYTDNLRDQDIIWIKMNEDGQPDEEWNSAHVGAGKYIDITEEDVIDYVSDDEDVADKIKEIKSGLPQELVLVVTCDCAPEYVEDEIADAISEETGWLINSFTYNIISETEIEEE